MVTYRGNGWGKYVHSEKDWFDHYIDTVDSITWTLNEIRKTNYKEAHIETL